MKKILIFISIIFIIDVTSLSVIAQFNSSTGSAPWVPHYNESNTDTKLENLTSRGFSYQATSTTASTLFKYFAGTPSAVTSIGTVKPNFFGAGDYANPTGVWKFYVTEQIVQPHAIYEVDTTTGDITAAGSITGVTAGHSLSCLEWDHTTNTFYVISTNVSASQLYTLNWTTKVATPVGPAITVAPGLIGGAFNANGNFFGIDLVNDNIWKVNKSTGVATMVGPSGYTANYGQDMGVDRSDFAIYWAACGGVVGLRTVDTATGATTQIGTFGSYTQVIATAFMTVSGPQIVHSPLSSTENLAGPYVVNAVINPAGAPIVASFTKVFWSRNNSSITDSVQMTNTSGNNWTANIPGNGTAATYRYYIRTADNQGRVATVPDGAPANLFQFVAAPDNVKPIITHTPIINISPSQWPPTVTCNVIDPSDWGGIDSVWVRWYKNTPSNGTFHIKLTNYSGNNYANPLNQPSSYIAVGDSIFYRIFARDNSSNHNMDSTARFAFKIVSVNTICMGSGMQSVGYPFYTFYMDSKTQMLFLKTEIGLPYSGVIWRVGFYVLSAAVQTMNGFQIKMQNTNLTSLSGFITSGWTTVYSGTYQVPGTGLRWIDLHNTFSYNSNNNLLVEICFNNSFYTSNTTVQSDSTITDRHWHRHADLSTGDGCTDLTMTGTAAGGRPIMCIYPGYLNPVTEPKLELPDKFKLYQNFPNPFNPSTTVSYYLPKQGNVTLAVFDLTGKELVRLEDDEFKQAGTYNIAYDASNLASGMYIYQIKFQHGSSTQAFIESKKMVLIK